MKHFKLFGFLISLLLPMSLWAADTYNVVKIQNKRTPAHYMVATSDGVKHLKDPGNDMAKWIIHEVAGGVQLQNVGTGLYVSTVPSNKISTLTNSPATLVRGTDNGTVFELNGQWMNASGSNDNVIGWAPIDDGSRWNIIEAGTLTLEEWSDAIDAANGLSKPVAGMYCRIMVPYYTRYMTEDYAAMNMNCQAKMDGDYRQMWQIVDAGNGKYNLQNVYTGHYIQAVPGASQRVSMTKTKTSAGKFSITQNTGASKIVRYYDIGTGGSYNYLHCDASKNIVGWTPGYDGLSATEWQFEAVELTQDDVDAARKDFEEKAGVLNNVDAYQAILDQLFTDKACTQINPAADFDALVTELPEVLANMARKVKDNAWTAYASGNNWEKTFRIADYQVYSQHNGMSGVVGMSNPFGRMTNPTGIMARSGDVLAIMVDSDIPANASLALEVYGSDSQGATGDQFRLKKGLNFVSIDKWSTFFIFYEINGTTDDPAYYLESFPNMKIHIEGGEVCGYWDKTRGMTDADWQAMMADGLFTFNRTQMKSDHIMMNMSTSHVKAKIPQYVERLVDIWNNIVVWENDMLGISDEWIPNISKRFNCLLNATSIDHNYMYATSYGTYYNDGTLNEILDYNNMLTSGGNIWGPAHEFGHNHQNLFNMAGMTEVSNNVFSNMVVFKQGATTSRGEAMDVIPARYASGTPWIDYGIWAQTQLYWKLYQYFHLAGHDTKFYQKVFNIMRTDPLRRRQNVQLNADVDYLHFAEVCCQAANADLSELFECYGMFRLMDEKDHDVNGGTIHGRYVGDYGDFYLHTTQAMIDAAKKKMKSYTKKIKNIIFIDDRIRESPAFYEGAPEGAMRKPFSNETTIGKGMMGDARCQWSDYADENMEYATGYRYSMSGRAVTVMSSGKNACGFKVYDKDGNLVYFTANYKFTLPQEQYNVLKNEGGYMVAAQADGTDVEMTLVNKNTYTVKTYRGKKDKMAISYVDGKIAPVLAPNWIAQVEAASEEGNAADYRYASNTNILVGNTIANLKVTDEVDMYIPETEGEITATKASFTRNGAKGWSTLALPFAYTVADLGSRITAYSDGGEGWDEASDMPTIELYTMAEDKTVGPGQPVVINSEKSNITINVNNAKVTNSAFDWDPKYDCDCLLGRPVNSTDSYDINSDGTAFDQKGVKAMHAGFWEAHKVAGISDAITIVKNDLDPEAMYNLSGIRITSTRKGEPYVKGGKVYINK